MQQHLGGAGCTGSRLPSPPGPDGESPGSTLGLFPLPWCQVLGEPWTSPIFACGPEEACTVTKWVACVSEQSGGGTGSGGERKHILPAPAGPHPRGPALFICPSVHPCLLQSRHPQVTTPWVRLGARASPHGLQPSGLLCNHFSWS